LASPASQQRGGVVKQRWGQTVIGVEVVLVREEEAAASWKKKV